jgi:MFS family permease
MVPKLNLILSLVCREYFIEKQSNDPTFVLPILLGSDDAQCRIPEVQALATKFTLYVTVITGSLSAVMSPKLGSLSDRFGRLKLLTITSFGGFLGEIIVIITATYSESVSYKWLLLGAVFDGLCGSFTAGMALTHAYATDCTPPAKRAVAFGYFHACLFSGIAVGPLVADPALLFCSGHSYLFHLFHLPGGSRISHQEETDGCQREACFRGGGLWRFRSRSQHVHGDIEESQYSCSIENSLPNWARYFKLPTSKSHSALFC